MNFSHVSLQRFVQSITVLTCLLLLSSCVTTTQDNQQVLSMVMHHDNQLPITIILPITWTVEQDSKKQAIVMNNSTENTDARIEAKKVEVNTVNLKLLKAFGRINIKSKLKGGWVQQRYADNLFFDGNQALQYVLRKDKEATIVYFTSNEQYIYIITINSSTDNISAANEVVNSSIRFSKAQPASSPQNTVSESKKSSSPAKEKVKKPLARLSASPNIFNLLISRLDSAQRKYKEDISNALPLLQKAKLIEQICFKYAFLKSESLPYAKNNDLRVIFQEARALFIHNQGIPDLARADALQSYINNRLDQAISKFESILMKNPDDIHAKLYLTMIRPYNSAHAKNSITEALAQYPENILAIYLQSLHSLAEGKKRASYDSLKQVLKKNPSHMWIGYVVAKNYNSEGNTKKAQQLYTKALNLYPAFTPARYSLALILYKEKKYPEAQKHLKVLLKADHDDPEAILLQGMIHKNQDRNSAAKQTFEAVLAVEPDNYRALYNIGALCATKLNDNNCARQAFTRYINVAPQNNRHSSITSWLKKN